MTERAGPKVLFFIYFKTAAKTIRFIYIYCNNNKAMSAQYYFMISSTQMRYPEIEQIDFVLADTNTLKNIFDGSAPIDREEIITTI